MIKTNFSQDIILPSDQSEIIEQATFSYSPLGKLFKKQIKTIEDQGIKQVGALKLWSQKKIRKSLF